MLMTKDELQQRFFNCYCVLFATRFFRSSQYKVVDDKQLIRRLWTANDINCLQIMENYYKELKSDKYARKDIMNNRRQNVYGIK